MRRIAAVFAVSLLLAGCAMPVGVRVAVWAVEGMVYLATSKSFTDHGLSLATGQDCTVLRAVTGEDLCHEWGEDQERADIRVVLGMIEPDFETTLGEGPTGGWDAPVMTVASETPIFDPYLGGETVVALAAPAPAPEVKPVLAADAGAVSPPPSPVAQEHEDYVAFDGLAALPAEIPALTVSFDLAEVDMLDRHGPRRAPFGMVTWTAFAPTGPATGLAFAR